MTTDNRTSEPTPEQVEVAAVASINSHRSRAGLPTLATLDGVPNADEWRDDARAALVAAQGAAPQAGSVWVPGYGGTGANKAAPVQPSSTVDEAALVQRIYDELMTDDAVAEVWSNGKAMATARRIVKFAVVEYLTGGTK